MSPRLTLRACVTAFAMAVLFSLAPRAHAAACSNDGSGFDSWLAAFKQRVAQQGISAATMSSALAGVAYDFGVIRLDRGQKSFKLSFEDFYRRRVSSSLLSAERS